MINHCAELDFGTGFTSLLADWMLSNFGMKPAPIVTGCGRGQRKVGRKSARCSADRQEESVTLQGVAQPSYLIRNDGITHNKEYCLDSEKCTTSRKICTDLLDWHSTYLDASVAGSSAKGSEGKDITHGFLGSFSPQACGPASHALVRRTSLLCLCRYADPSVARCNTAVLSHMTISPGFCHSTRYTYLSCVA